MERIVRIYIRRRMEVVKTDTEGVTGRKGS